MPTTPATCLILDGTAVAYRAFFGIPALSTAAGQPTQALLGFVRMLQKLRRIWSPTHGAVVFDGGLPAARLAQLPDYKAQRPGMPDGLRQQLPLLEEYLRLAGVPSLRRVGEEADDLIASLVGPAARDGGRVLVVTSDKDMFQLVEGRVELVSPARMEAAIGPAEVRARTGVAPAAIIDWLALVGDTSDNIPGVPGVGPKTAAGLLEQFGSLAALWDRLGDVTPPALRDKLAAQRALIERNQELVRLRRDLPDLPEPDQLRWGTPDAKGLRAFFEQYELHSLAAELQAAPPAAPPPQQTTFLF